MKSKTTKTDIVAALADSKGRKLGLLIASLPADDEIKEAFMALAENSSYEELEKLSGALEALYLNASTRDIDDQFKKDLALFKQETETGEQKITDVFLAKLSAIEEKIKS